ncbi:MAG: protein kinase, partial [Verrucomicrobiota bacterium]|nr:protein kinase [Verrucomicrobiota bacterium]
MEYKIFLTKYRVAADEIALTAAEPSSTVSSTFTIDPAIVPRVYRGLAIDSGQDVSVEVIPAHAFKHAVREQLEAEAITAKKINHINIPTLFDFGIEDDQLIYVTEYFDGTSAEEWVNVHGAMPTGAVLRIALQVIGAMGAASFHKISHHAINPGNLILVPGQTPEGDWPLVKVLHFVGVAPSFASADTSVAAFDKSTHYASPEQLQHGNVDFRSEIYSLGATMWFLLTGAPPLMAPKGPLAMQPTTIGLAVDKLNGMPKKVRRLLAQMLAADPGSRPQDPLALYRQMQDCVAQVDRRETMARRFGVPFLSGSNVAALPSRQRFPKKLVALAAMVIALVTLTAVLMSNYLRHQRIREAEEPIGVPIGVSDATPSGPPVLASVPAPTEPSAQTNTAQETQAPAPARVESTPVAVAKNEPSVAPVQLEPTAPPRDVRPAEQPKVVSNEPAPPPTNVQQEEQPKVAPNEPKVVQQTTTAPPTEEPVRPEVREPEPSRKTEVAAAALPTARPISPEVRRAEPAPPGEGPEEAAPASTEKKVVTTTKARKERATKPKRDPEEVSAPETRVANEDEG